MAHRRHDLCIVAVLCVFFAYSTAAPLLPSSLAATRENVKGNTHSLDTLWYDQVLDHFSFSASTQRYFRQRVLVNRDHWKMGGPIFFYTGNEGDIAWFAENTGFMWDIAPEFGAMLVFSEHRYYGESLPFGNASFTPENVQYLTVEQALADHATVIDSVVRGMPGADQSPIVAFGGSYGGMLAAWLRAKYPSVVVGAIAASAPVLQVWGDSAGTEKSSEGFSTIATTDFVSSSITGDLSTSCQDRIRRSWDAIAKLATSSRGLEELSSSFRLCKDLTPESIPTLQNWLYSAYTFMAMADYPYPANFLNPMPAYPCRVACGEALRGTSDIDSAFRAISVYYNHTGSAECFDILSDATSNLGTAAWDFQSCTEVILPVSANGKSDMFYSMPFDLAATQEHCRSAYRAISRPRWGRISLGGKETFRASSNIVFSNGKYVLDPWFAGGVTETLSDTVVAVVIPDGAHHLDLRAANPADPPSVIRARDIHRQHIRRWIAEHAQRLAK